MPRIRPNALRLLASVTALLALASLLPAAPIAARSPQPEAWRARPTIVLLVIDDMAQVGREVWERMPTIGPLFLDQGVVFPRAIGNDPLCCPGRATLLTGLRSVDHGVVDNDARLFDPRVTLATELRAEGYRTGLFGKYLNDVALLADRTPPGWDRVVTGDLYYDTTWFVDGTPVRIGTAPEDYTTDRIRRSAEAFIDRAGADRPLFLLLSPFAVHDGKDETGVEVGPGIPVPAPRHRGDARCQGLDRWQTPAHTDTDETDLPAFQRAVDTDAYADGWDLVPACETLLSVDELVAGVADRLRATGRKNVLWVLVADNGMGWGKHGWALKRTPHALPQPLMIAWPRSAEIEPRSIPITVSTLDVAPTICAAAGCRMGPFPDGSRVSGVDLLPLLTGERDRLGREVLPMERTAGQTWGRITARVPSWSGVWTTERFLLGRWLYVRYRTGGEELYDVDADPFLTVNRAADPTVAATREALIAAWRVLQR